ncbi:MAG: hypothetical protein AAFN50_09665 [Pseudomonadota bacterium]
MKLKTYLFPLTDEGSELLASLVPESASKVISARWPIMSENPVLPEVFKAGESTGGFWVSAEAVLSSAEQNETTHFEVVCRKVVSASDEDFETNRPIEERASLVDRGGEAPIRLAKGFSLTRIALKPNMVGAIGGWESEYVCGSAVASVFDPAVVSGLSFLPVNNPKTNTPHDGFHQIYSDSVLGPAIIDCSIERIQSDHPEEDGQLRHLGNLAYPAEALTDKADFLRTAEPWAGWFGWPSWVVSRKVVDMFRDNKLRGWVFRPVLLSESDTYSSYLEQWRHLNELVSTNSQSEFDGGR